MTQFRDSWVAIAPPWLRTGVGEKFMYTLELARDVLMDKINQAVKIRIPGQGDASQLPYLANDRGLVQGPAETDASFITRLTGSIASWKYAGSARAVLEQVQAYIQNLQPGVSGALPSLAIVGGSYPTVATWHTLSQGDVQGAVPSLTQVRPSNFNWDGKNVPWRSWLIVYLSLVPTGLSGSSASITGSSGGSLLGQNVNGVWVPGTSGTPVNTPFYVVSGLTGLSSANTGQWITMSGGSIPGNVGTFPIVEVFNGTQCQISNPFGSVGGGSMTWSIGEYPWMGPAGVWGGGIVANFGSGQNSNPPIDTGSNVGGVWQPTISSSTYGTTLSWGLNVSSLVIQTIRGLVKSRKSAATYYPNLVVAFDGGSGAINSAYSPNSAPGTGNPDGTFGSVGKLVSGVWVPTREITSAFDAYCQGTGTHVNCSAENVN